jgi:hypothetical protein
MHIPEIIKRLSIIKYLLATAFVLTITALTEYSFGRTILCKCGYLKLWEGQTMSSDNSQHLIDWYTFSHIIHGFGFFYLSKLFKKLTIFQVFILALLIESGWEIIENSSFIIDRYRAGTISLNYYGDSIINSLIDILAMTLGFYLARKLPLWIILSLTLITEMTAGYVIRDNLMLNILMLIYPLEVIKNWQMSAI